MTVSGKVVHVKPWELDELVKSVGPVCAIVDEEAEVLAIVPKGKAQAMVHILQWAVDNYPHTKER